MGEPEAFNGNHGFDYPNARSVIRILAIEKGSSGKYHL